jgi:hypothetical protein
MTLEYIEISEAVAHDIDEGHRRDPAGFMRRSRVRSAMSVIADAIATPEEAQEMYGVEFTDEELDQARTIQSRNCAQA